MGMTIEECIKHIGDMRRNYDRWSGLGLTPNEAEAFKTIIDTMRKYQKIEALINSWELGLIDNIGYEICEVIDGKDD